jgi:hypothetical protein
MRTRTLSAPATMLAFALAAPAAHGATTIGDTSSTPGPTGSSGVVFVQATDPTGTPYGVPAGGGVVTSVSARMVNTGSVLVVRPAGGGTYTVVGGQAVPAPATPADLSTAPARIPVEAGDRLAGYADPGGALAAATDTSATFAGFPVASAPSAGQTLSGSTTNGSVHIRLLLGATIEPDADHDGYGDETQDSCPAIPTIHDGPCTTDLSVSAAAEPGSIVQGDVTTIVAPITVGGGAASAVTATLSVPAGLSVIAASTTAGDCTGVICPLGDLAVGETRKAYIVVRGTALGAQALGVTATSSRTDGNLADNAAAAVVTVLAPPVATPPSVTTPPPPPSPPAVSKLCRVPSLKGKTAAAAKAALAKAGCKAGKASGSKAKKAKVKSQTIPAGVRVAAGTKVAYSLKAPAKPRPKPKKHR